MNHHLAPHITPRHQLMRLMDGYAEKRLIYMMAPAGFGKTIAATLWLERQKADTVMISLDEYDNDPEEFCRRFCQALARIQPDNEKLMEYVRHPGFSSAPDEFLMRAVRALSPAGKAFIAFDDVHYIRDPHILRYLPAAIKRLPENIRLLLISRNAPPDVFAELVVKDSFAMITAEHLRFDKEEIQDFFQANGRALTKSQLNEIADNTGGWAIGLNMVSMSGGMPDQLLNQNYLESFIRRHVWGQWPQSLRDFMVETCVEEEMTPGLCDTLTGRTNSGTTLRDLVRENAFIEVIREDAYRYHPLFRSFLLTVFREKPPEFRMEQYRRAGRWYFQSRQFYRAIEAFVEIGDRDGVVQSMYGLLEASRLFNIQKTIDAFRYPLVRTLADEDPAFIATKAWTAFCSGYPDELEKGLDAIFRPLEAGAQRNSPVNVNTYYLLCIDYRVPLDAFAAGFGEIPLQAEMQNQAGTITQNMPFFHRSSRDFSDYAGEDMAARVAVLKNRIGGLFGRERDVFEACVLAGLRYERGELTEAHGLAISANAKIEPGFSPEAKFCAMMILMHISRALLHEEQSRMLAERIRMMIEEEKAFFLCYNLDAYDYRCRLDNGDIEVAEQWMQLHGADPFEHVDFLHLYGFFTTARAYITLGSNDRAILVLKKILELCRRYRRPLDVIEALLLLAIACWKKKRGYQQEALGYLEEAVLLAYPYGYTQAFVNEGADLHTMLHRLQSRAVRKNYSGALPGSFVKMLYVKTYGQAQQAKGLTGGRTAEKKYTEQQKKVMRLLCEGCSYRQIAEQMGIKFSTVRSHIELIYKKLDVANETEAVLKIIELGILDGEA